MLLMLFVMLIFSACTKTKVEYVDREVKVYVPIVATIPMVDCDFNKSSDADVVIELYRCLYDTREVCYGN